MAIEIFGEGVNDNVSTLEEWRGIEWREEGIVDENEGCLAREGDYTKNVD
jgi:hypothetical protein